MNEITEKKVTDIIYIYIYVNNLTHYSIVVDEVIKMNKRTEKEGNKYTCKQSSDTKID